MAQRPSEKPDWVPDNTTGITAPNVAKRAAGWILEKPPFQYFNWFWNLLSQWADFFGGQAEEWIVIDSDADEQDYATLAAYIADAPAAGDKVLVKEDQTITAQMVWPSGITVKFLDGARLLCATNIATSVLQLGSDIVIEGVLEIVLSHTGTTALAVEFNGDNVTGKINVENSSTGTLTLVAQINASKTGNHVTGFVDNTGGGVLTGVLTDSSTEDSNLVAFLDAVNNIVVRARGANTMQDGFKFALGSDAAGDVYYNNGTKLVRLAAGAENYALAVNGGLPVWAKGPSFIVASNWFSRTSAADNEWRGVAWSPSLLLFVAVSSSGTGNRVMTSPNGINWTIRTSAADNGWQDVAWSPSLALFAAVANSGTGNRVMTSPDGINWTIRTSAADNNWVGVAWSPSLALFVAVATSGVGNRVMTSPDGINWTIRTSAADNQWQRVVWAEELTLFVAVATSGVGNRVMTSPDGINWTIRTSAADRSWRGVAWSPTASIFAAVASDGAASTQVMTSPDGITWTSRTVPIFKAAYSVAYSPELNIFAAITNQGFAFISPNGINWEAKPVPVSNVWGSVAWSPELGKFAAVSYTGTGNRALTSLAS